MAEPLLSRPIPKVPSRQCRCGRGPVQAKRGWLVCRRCADEGLAELRAREPYDPETGLSRYDPVKGPAAGAVADLARGGVRSSWQKCPAPPGRAERLRAWASRWLGRLGAMWRRLAPKPRRRIQRPPPPAPMRGHRNSGERPPKPDYRPPAQRPPPPGAGSAIRPPPRDHTDLRDASRELLAALKASEPGLSPG